MFVLSWETTWGKPTTTMLESRVAMKMPTVVTVRTTHLYCMVALARESDGFQPATMGWYKEADSMLSQNRIVILFLGLGVYLSHSREPAFHYFFLGIFSLSNR